jgi:hypothetical protein
MGFFEREHGGSDMSYWAKEMLPEWWNRHDAQEAERHGISIDEWRGFKRDQAAFEEEEHRGRLSLSGSEGICNPAQEGQH